MDGPEVCRVPEDSGGQGKIEETRCEITCGAPRTLAVKGVDDDDPEEVHENVTAL